MNLFILYTSFRDKGKQTRESSRYLNRRVNFYSILFYFIFHFQLSFSFFICQYLASRRRYCII